MWWPIVCFYMIGDHAWSPDSPHSKALWDYLLKYTVLFGSKFPNSKVICSMVFQRRMKKIIHEHFSVSVFIFDEWSFYFIWLYYCTIRFLKLFLDQCYNLKQNWCSSKILCSISSYLILLNLTSRWVVVSEFNYGIGSGNGRLH